VPLPGLVSVQGKMRINVGMLQHNLLDGPKFENFGSKDSEMVRQEEDDLRRLLVTSNLFQLPTVADYLAPYFSSGVQQMTNGWRDRPLS
jgi:hypothetical protein